MTNTIRKEIEEWAALNSPEKRQKKQSKEMQQAADESLKEIKDIQSWSKTKMPAITGQPTIINPLKP